MSGIAPLDVRVAAPRLSRDEARVHFAAAGVESEPTRWSPQGLRLGRKTNITHIEGLRPGDVEVQDEGSQLVSLALGAGHGWHVLDACAGAGGKTLHLSELIGPEGRVFAHDTDAARLDILKSRAEEAGLLNVEILAPGSAAAAAPYDAVLIDAPCVGLGRLRREPTLAWRGPLAERLAETAALQRKCLDDYAPLVKPGGILVYAVCSVEPEETGAMVEYLRETHPDFAPEQLPEPLPKGDAWCEGSITLLPSVHNTDGFFIARWRRGGGA